MLLWLWSPGPLSNICSTIYMCEIQNFVNLSLLIKNCTLFVVNPFYPDDHELLVMF